MSTQVTTRHQRREKLTVARIFKKVESVTGFILSCTNSLEKVFNSKYFMLIMTGVNMYLINLYLLLLHNLRITENYELIREAPIAVYKEEEEGYSDDKISNTEVAIINMTTPTSV